MNSITKDLIENLEMEDDIPIAYTSSADLHSISSPHDSTAEIVVYIDAIEASRLVGSKNHTILKFFVNNNSGDRVQVITWNDDVKRIEPVLRTNHIVHIDGAYVKPCLISNFNKGTLNIELIIQSNTIVNILGAHNVPNVDELAIPESVPLENVGKSTGYIRVQGFIKSNFFIITRQTVKSNDFGCGSITDGRFKLEVRIAQMENNHEFTKGDHVEIKGYLQRNANPVHFLVKSIEDVRFIDNVKMSLPKLLRGCQSIPTKREEPGSNESMATKRIKSN